MLGIVPYFAVIGKLKNLEIPPHYFVSKKNDPNHFPPQKT